MADLIHAHTERTGPSPAYINVSRTPQGVRVIVRTRGAEGTSEIVLPVDQAASLGLDLARLV